MNIVRIHLFTAAILAAVVSLIDAQPQKDFHAIPKELAGQYTVDLARYFYPTPEAEKTARSELYQTLSKMEEWKGKIAASPDNLLNVLQLYNAALIEFQKHESYLYLRSSIDTKDETSSAEDSALSAEFTKRTAFLNQELTQINSETLNSFIKTKPELEKFRYAIELNARYGPHTLPLDEEEFLNSLSPFTTDWQMDLYQTLLSRIPFGVVHTKEGDLDIGKQRTAINNSPDRAARETAFKKRYAALNSQRDLYAFDLLHLVNARNYIAQLHHFKNAPEQIYFNSYLTETGVNELFHQISQHAELYKRYQNARVDIVKKNMGYSDVNFWDLSALPPGIKRPRFDISEATATIQKAVAPLGNDYGSALSALLNPANRRLDITGGENRAAGGFSLGFPGMPSIFYSASFDGYYNDVRILTHESTHAIHRDLIRTHGVMPVYADGPHFLFESFAILNELLLADYLYEHETDPERKRFFLEQFLEGKGMEIFVAAHDASLEQAIYDGVMDKKITNADDLDAVTKTIDSQYSIWTGRHEEMKYQWISMRLMYEDPLYLVNYMYAGLLSLEYYKMFKENPKAFLPKYISLMENGFDAPPDVLLKRIGIDMNDPALVDNAVTLLTPMVNALAAP